MGGALTAFPPAGGGRGRRWLAALGLHRPELRAWAMYDWANSGFVTTVIAAVFPIYFVEVAGRDLGKAAEERYSLATAVAMVIVAAMAPFLGAVAELLGMSKRLLGGFMALAVAATAGLFFVHTGDWRLATVLFVAANVGAAGSFVFYDSLLPHVAHRDELDRVSSAGYALGYVGGGLLLALDLAWIERPGWFGLPSGEGLSESQATLPARLAFLSVAVWWVVFSVPLFRRVPEPPRALPPGGGAAGRAVLASVARLRETLRTLRRQRDAFVLLLAFLCYNDGIGTILRLGVAYAADPELNLDRGALIASILMVQFVGIPFAFAFGWLAGKVGAKRAVLGALVVYLGISVLAFRLETERDFLVIAFLVAMVQGGAQALSRSLFASMIPRQRSAEYFGLFGVVEKFAGIAGPAVFWAIAALGAPSQWAILSVVVFFAAGGALLLCVDVERGRAAARAAEAGVA